MEQVENKEDTLDTLNEFAAMYDKDNFLTLHEEMSFGEYLNACLKNPKLTRNAFQFTYDMIVSKGKSTFERYRKTHTRYHFFDDKKIPIWGLDETLEAFVDFVHGAAGHYGTERRVLLLHGPVGSSKSTICRCLKKGLEEYSRTDAGKWYTYKWVNLPYEGMDAIYTDDTCAAPMNENPLKLMPLEVREPFLAKLNEVNLDMIGEDSKELTYKLVCEGELNPRCKMFMGHLLEKYNGDWGKVVTNHIRVVRKCHSEADRVAIGTFQPKDEKNQDSTELTGDMNYSKISHFGSDSDPRAFNFDGEFQVGNRGVVEFIEMLKLAKEFLYDLLGVSQEHQIKPKKFSQIVVDEFIVAHTNNPEYEKLKSDPTMEALRDRTVKIDVPYLLRASDEQKIYEHSYGPGKIRQHIMPHTLEIAAHFAVLTRLQEDDGKLSVSDKLKLYDGKSLPGHTEDTVKELRDKFPEEGMKTGLSARFIQDKIANCLAKNKEYVNVFMVMNEIKEGLKSSSLITNKDDKAKYEAAVDLAIQELDEILKDEVQRALVADEQAIERLCSKYIDNVMAYVNNEKMINPITQKPIDPDERLMRSIESKIGIGDRGAPDFRRTQAQFIGTLANKGKKFNWDSNEELKRALKAKIFEDVKDTIKLSSLTKEASQLDPELQEKIDAIKTRLVKQYGYNDRSATDVLEYVSSIFARGDIDERS